MEFDIMGTINVPVTRYQYRLKEDGTRDIDTHFPIDEVFSFKFTVDAFEAILFRDGPDKLSVDGMTMYFDMKDSKLNSIHFEDKYHIWIISDMFQFMSECKENYVRMSAMSIFMTAPSNMPPHTVGTASYVDEDDMMDEFDLENLE